MVSARAIAASSTGKSYIPLELVPYFPIEDVIKLGYSSPTSFFHKHSVWLRDPRLPPFPEDYEEDEEEAKKRKARENVYLIDLHKKILVFIDAPHSELLKNMRALISHDDKYIELNITDRSQKSGLRTKRILLVGYPTIIHCSANTLLDEQEKTRLNLYSPESSAEKIREAIAHKINKDGNYEAYKKAIEENPKRRILKDRVSLVKGARAYDRDESEAWLTFEHEVYEFKFKEVTFPYRTLVNSLIEAVEKLTYERKETFLEFLPKVSGIISREKTQIKDPL